MRPSPSSKTPGTIPAERITLGSHVYTALCALADHEAESGDPRHALEIYQQLLDKVMATNPDVFNDLRDAPKLSRIYTALAVLYRRTGDVGFGPRHDCAAGGALAFLATETPPKSLCPPPVRNGAPSVPLQSRT